MITEFKKNSLLLTSVLILSCLSFYPIFKSDFINWDDDYFVTENYIIRHLDKPHLKQIFTTPLEEVYIPLTILLYSIEYHFFNLNPLVFHLNSLLFHFLDVALIFMFALQLGLNRTAAGFAALLFSIHPMHVEAVAWVSARKDVLYSFFYLLSLIYYWRYLKNQRMKEYLFSLTFGLFSILAKPMALSLPLILFVCDWFYRRKFSPRILLDKLPYFAYIIPITWITYSLHTRIPGKTIEEAILLWVWSFTFYIKKIFLPLELVPLYQPPQPVSITQGPYLTALIIFVVILSCIVIFRKNRWFIFAVLFYFFSMFFLFRFDVGHDQTFVADRFMYLPSLGFCLLAGKWMEEGRARLKNKLKTFIFNVLFIILLVSLSIKTHAQVKIWHDSLTLWDYIIEKNVQYPTIFNNRGLTYNKKGEYARAIADFNRAIELNPLHASAYSNRGQTLINLGRYDLAFEDLSRALTIEPDYKTLLARGDLYTKLKKWDLALKDCDRALSLYPNGPLAYNYRGVVYLNLRDFSKALEDFNQALMIDPRYPEALGNKAYALIELGQTAAAIEVANKAIELDSHQASSYYNRGKAYLILGDNGAAVDDFNRTLTLDPKYAYAYYCRAQAFSAQGEFDKASRDMRSARSLGVGESGQLLKGPAK